jgi:class 3 adenylate cyclase
VPRETPLHRTIVVFDVAEFTGPASSLVHQRAVHEGLYEVLSRAFAESGIPLEECTVEDRGDGAMILIPAEVSKANLADRFPDRLLAGLRRYNAVRATEAQVQLRVALHAGEVRYHERGTVSPAVNFAFRILDAPEARFALKRSEDVLALIASDLFYQEVILHDPGAEPEAYKRIPVAVKETTTEAWLRTRPGDNRDENLIDVLLPFTELERLHEWLDGVQIGQLSTIARRAAGPIYPIPRTDEAWQVFRDLLDFNAGSDGVPPALVFVALLAEQVAPRLRDDLRSWVSDQARRLHLEPALSARGRTETLVPGETKLHLLIAVEPDGIDANRCTLSYWRQDDPEEWPPARGLAVEVALDELERRVDELVLDSERAWRNSQSTTVLEFLLPRSLLHLPVHRWHKEISSGMPRPLFLDYPVVVRSLERMKAPYWHRVWHARWRTLTQDPSGGRIYFGHSMDVRQQPREIDVALSDPRWVSVVLSDAPTPEPAPRQGDELTAALRAGVPIMMWHPKAAPDTLREIVDWLAKDEGLADLPARTRACRMASLTSSPAPFDVALAQDLVVLWDDPQRMVVLGEPAYPPPPAGEPADDHERASAWSSGRRPWGEPG